MAEATHVHLGADAWALLAEAVPGSRLPYPFRVQDGPALDAAARAATMRALRDGTLLVGDRGDLLADLDPPLRAGLLALARPAVVVDASTGLGDALRLSHHAIRGDLAAGLVCSQRPAGEDELELSPVELSTLPAGALAAEILRGFGSLEGEPDRTAVPLGAAASVAVARALEDLRLDRARAVVERHAVPPPLDALAAGLRSVARVDVTSAAGRHVLVALRVANGWWTLRRSGDDVRLHPAGEDELSRELARALAPTRKRG